MNTKWCHVLICIAQNTLKVEHLFTPQWAILISLLWFPNLSIVHFSIGFLVFVLICGSFLYAPDSSPESEQTWCLHTACSRNGLFQLLQIYFSSLLSIDITPATIMWWSQSLCPVKSTIMTRVCAVTVRAELGVWVEGDMILGAAEPISWPRVIDKTRKRVELGAAATTINLMTPNFTQKCS